MSPLGPFDAAAYDPDSETIWVNEDTNVLPEHRRGHYIARAWNALDEELRRQDLAILQTVVDADLDAKGGPRLRLIIGPPSAS